MLQARTAGLHLPQPGSPRSTPGGEQGDERCIYGDLERRKLSDADSVEPAAEAVERFIQPLPRGALSGPCGERSVRADRLHGSAGNPKAPKIRMQ